MSESFSIILESKLQEVRESVTQTFKGVAVYLAIIGAVLKYSFDQNSTPDLKLILLGFALTISVLAILASVFGVLFCRQLSRDIAWLSKEIGITEMKSNAMSYKFVVALAFMFFIACTVGVGILFFKEVL